MKNLYIIIGLILVIGLSIFLYRRYKINQEKKKTAQNNKVLNTSSVKVTEQAKEIAVNQPVLAAN